MRHQRAAGGLRRTERDSRQRADEIEAGFCRDEVRRDNDNYPKYQRDGNRRLRADMIGDYAEHDGAGDCGSLHHQEEEREFAHCKMERGCGEDGRERDDGQDAIVIDEKRDKERRDVAVLAQVAQRAGGASEPILDEVPMQAGNRLLADEEEERQREYEKKCRGDDEGEPDVGQVFGHEPGGDERQSESEYSKRSDVAGGKAVSGDAPVRAGAGDLGKEGVVEHDAALVAGVGNDEEGDAGGDHAVLHENNSAVAATDVSVKTSRNDFLRRVLSAAAPSAGESSAASNIEMLTATPQ